MKIRRNRFEINFTRVEHLLERPTTEFERGEAFRSKADGLRLSLVRYSETKNLKEQGHRLAETYDDVPTVILGEAV